MPSRKYSSGKQRGDTILFRGFVPKDHFEAVKKYFSEYETESNMLRRVIYEWLEMQKKKEK